ncbi:MAG: DUF6138 family protein [Synergistaceae bacterium]|nr:DUF6138 family protein [Synergistaceae bacterium]
MEYYLKRHVKLGFHYENARDFCERFRRLTGFSFDFRYPLEQWVHRCLRDPNFTNENTSGTSWKDKWLLKPAEDRDFIPLDFMPFACYIATCHMKYGASCHSLQAKEIFDIVAALGSDLPAKMKKNGSGTLPRDMTEYKSEKVFCKANDAFATVKIAFKSESEGNYATALRFLHRLLEAEFPRSYSIDFRSPDKNFLPVKGLPKKGVHQMFANAVRYPALYPDVERYARLAMKEYELYVNLQNEACVMPGTFAVFALALADVRYAPLLRDYLDLCDDEHSHLQGKFLPVYIEKFGFTDDTVGVFLAGAGSMQTLPPNKIYATAIANEESLRLLANSKRDCDEYVWQAVLYALWGKDAVYENGKIHNKRLPI